MARKPKKPDLAMLRVRAVGMVFQHEVDTGHLNPVHAKWMLARMDEAYQLLLNAANPPTTPPEAPTNG